MGEFSPTTKKGDCEEIANLSTAFGRRRRNWIDAHGAVPDSQVVDASCGNRNCIALRHSDLRPRVEQPRKYPKIAKRVHRLRVGQHFDVPGVGTDERSRNRFRSGLYAAARLDKVSVRGLPDGSVLVGNASTRTIRMRLENVLDLYCRPPIRAIFSDFCRSQQWESKPLQLLIFLVLLGKLSTIIAAVVVRGFG